jgi:hypothetical protein
MTDHDQIFQVELFDQFCEIIGIPRLDPVNEPLFKRRDFRGISGSGR